MAKSWDKLRKHRRPPMKDGFWATQSDSIHGRATVRVAWLGSGEAMLTITSQTFSEEGLLELAEFCKDAAQQVRESQCS